MDLSIEALEGELELLAAGHYLADPVEAAREAIALLTPPELISTTECAARYRLIPSPIGSGETLWSPTLTPYINGVQDALDHPETNLVIVPKPGQVGGTVGAENYAFKRMKFGPMANLLWYLPSDSEVDSYVDRNVAPMFRLHPDIQAKVGRSRSDDKRKFKRIAGRIAEWLQINRKTITGRTGGIIVVDEIDAANPKLRATMVGQMLTRGATLGSQFKGYICSHMDAGWTSGIAAAWKESSRGIWYWACPHCGGYSSPCPSAPKGWRTTLDYERPSGVSDDEMLDRVEATAGLLCPHCGKKAADIHKPQMLLSGKWVHEGQTIDRDGNVTGEPKSRKVMGFWIHGTMSPWVGWGDLARRYVSALVFFERTKKSERLREVTAKVLGEVYEGGGENGAVVDPVKLAERPVQRGFYRGTVPAGVRFVTAAVDVGHAKFDVLIVGWDLEGRSWIIDRFTIRQRRVGRNMVDIRPAERQDDWLLIRDEVLRRELPLADDPGMMMPVAGVAVDTGDGNVTWKAREFARRMAREGEFWGRADAPWQRVRLIKGSNKPTAPELPVTGRKVSKDEEGREVSPTVLEWELGVHRLKSQAVERLGEEEGGPGQVRFASGLPRSTFDEFAGEVLIDGTWERRGPNESLDLFAYCEAVRLMLRPERVRIDWDERPPVWARPVAANDNMEAGAAPAEESAKTPKPSLYERYDNLSRRTKRNG